MLLWWQISRVYLRHHFSVEVSVRGQVTRENKARLKAFVYRVCSEPKVDGASMLQDCSFVIVFRFLRPE